MSTVTLRTAISDNILPPAMRDFWAGMHCLHRYATRCHANTEAIGSDNLRVLHDTLMADRHYRHALVEAEQSTFHRGTPISRKLFTTADIEAEILSLRQDSSLQLAPQTHSLSLVMLLSGQAAVDGDERPPLTITGKILRRLSRAPQSFGLLKPGGVIVEKRNASTPVLKAMSNVCVILRVSLSLPSFATSLDRQYPSIVAVG